MGSRSSTWVVIPLFNESQVINEVLQSLLVEFSNVVCVDDASSDDSGQKALEAGAYVITHPINLGQGAALRTGMDFVLRQKGAQSVITFDSDGQHRVEDAISILNRLNQGDVDIVIGSRFLDGRTKPGFLKKIVLKTAIFFSNASTGVRLTDAHNGLRVMTIGSAKVIRITQNRMAHASEIISEISRNKLRVAEVPVHVMYTDYSKSKGQSILNSINILSDLFMK